MVFARVQSGPAKNAPVVKWVLLTPSRVRPSSYKTPVMYDGRIVGAAA